MSIRGCHHPVFARLYAWASNQAEGHGATDHRRELLEGLSGRVLEVGAGNGLNFALYPESVAEVVALEPEPYLRRLATRNAAAAPVHVRVVDGLAESLEYDDGSFDGAVAALVLCSVADPDQALAELHRVLRPGGELRFYEHVRAQTPRLAHAQRNLDRLWPKLAGGCHSHRDTLTAIERQGFHIERVRRFSFPSCLFARPVSPHVIGMARRP